MSEREEKIAVLELAMEAGRLLLENGAEIFRVDETMERICRHYGVTSANFFVVSNGIFVSAGSMDEPLFAKVQHLPVQSGRLDWVCAVNQLSREIESGKYTVEEAREVLEEIRRMPGKSNRALIIAGGLGAAMFCQMFGGCLSDSAVAFCVGVVLQFYMVYVVGRHVGKLVGTLGGGALITCLCIILYRLEIGQNLSHLIISTVMLLVPGLAFVNGIRDLANTDYLSGAVRILDALLRFAFIAIGVGLVFIIYHRVFGGRYI